MGKQLETEVEGLLRKLVESGAAEAASAVSDLFDLARRVEDEREEQREPRTIDAAIQAEPSLSVNPASNGAAPSDRDTGKKTRALGSSVSPDPGLLDRGSRSSRALFLVLAEMDLKGVSTPEADDLIARFGISGVTNAQFDQAAALLDDELDAWCNRSLEEVRYVILGERRELVRQKGVVTEASVLCAIGVGLDERRRIIGVSCAPSQDRLHWRVFLEDLVQRGMRGVQFIVSDNFDGLRAAREAVFPAVPWQHCQGHLTQGAIDHAPAMIAQKRLNSELRQVWDAPSFQDAMAELGRLVEAYRTSAPILAAWMNDHIPEGLAVFGLPEIHRRFMRSAQSMERTVQQELKRAAPQVRIFPSMASLDRLVRAVLVEVDEKWAWAEQSYLKWDDKTVDQTYAYS